MFLIRSQVPNALFSHYVCWPNQHVGYLMVSCILHILAYMLSSSNVLFIASTLLCVSTILCWLYPVFFLCTATWKSCVIFLVSQRWMVNNTHHQHLWSQCLKSWPHTRIWTSWCYLETYTFSPEKKWPSWNPETYGPSRKYCFTFPPLFSLVKTKTSSKKQK